MRIPAMLSRSRRISTWLLYSAFAVALLFAFAKVPTAVAQASAMASGQAPQALHIVILDGEDALNNIRQRTAREPIVQVQDENHRPVAGAVVIFTIRKGQNGAGGSFAGGPSLAVVTGLDGQAVATGLVPNAVQGSFTITVTASAAGAAGALTTSALLSQSNIVGPAGPSSSTQQAQANTTSGASSGGASAGTTAAHHAVIHLFTAHFWAVAGVTAAGAAAVTTTVILTHNSGATITPGNGTVKP